MSNKPNTPTKAVAYTYFVSYHYSSSSGFTVGNIDVTTGYPLATMADIRYLESDLRHHLNAPNILILGFSPIEPS